MLESIPSTQSASSKVTEHSKDVLEALEVKATTKPKDNIKSLNALLSEQVHGKKTCGDLGFGSLETNSFSAPQTNVSRQGPYPQWICFICLLAAPINQSRRGLPPVQQWNKTVQFGPDTSWIRDANYNHMDQYGPRQINFRLSTSFNGVPVYVYKDFISFIIRFCKEY